MNSLIVCVDASIVIDHLIRPEDLQLHTLWESWGEANTQLVAPALLRYEATNALFQKVKKGQLTLGTTSELVRVMLALPVQLYTDLELHTRAFQIAQELSLGATYDAYYLALADQLQCELWTRNAKLTRAASQKYSWVKLLE